MNELQATAIDQREATRIRLTVNGKLHLLDVDGNTRLLDLVRNDLGHTGTKEGCSVGECGACTVIMNQEAVCSCMVLAAQCNGAEITTIEGVAEDPLANQLQQSFIEEGGVQCGFCTPGVLMSTKALLDKKPTPSDDEIMDALEGNLCRCTGYQPIMNSVKAVIARNHDKDKQ
ncbi:(2Fe-2S)-binding protein [Photobacterium profundum]|uniref:Putative oxidoreductase protein n=1 Tax=Photobacterium profundum 3TCK TaxID=314280 RepID=Q1Z556_9GAMM|nr:(2Fe-2S)-binding protein [Photobacterium profundum]EAS43710.1 putative oxidoreductase protein [Photobacterium profundum 3TCK]PSV64114.1 (2Fe-2S)-binding protein [Photobacterium profundum]